MRSEKRYRLVRNLQSAAWDVYRQAERDMMTQEWIGGMIAARVYNTDAYRELPRYAQTEIDGYIRCLFDQLWFRELIVCTYRILAEPLRGELRPSKGIVDYVRDNAGPEYDSRPFSELVECVGTRWAADLTKVYLIGEGDKE